LQTNNIIWLEDVVHKLAWKHKVVDFFDTHDMGPYLDALPEAYFEFSQKRSKVLTEIDPKLSDELSKIARAKGISSTRLLNSILRKGIKQEKQTA